jgi:dCTP deaminase
MVLSDVDISEELDIGNLEIDPLNAGEQIQPCSVDIRIGDEYSEYEGTNIVMDSRHTDAERHLIKNHIAEDDSVMIHPGDFYLFNTEEYIEIPNYLECEVRGRSSFGRLGLEVHSTAGLVDSGFEGKLVLEVSNNGNNPIRLYRGDRVAQLVFNRLETPSDVSYGEKNDSKYQKQRGAVGSRIWEDNNG